MDMSGPTGFQHIESAPRNGTFVRLRFRPSDLKGDPEEVGRWVADDTMKAGGWWMDREGYYITGPLFWASISPVMMQAQRAARTVDNWSATKKAWARRVTQ